MLGNFHVICNFMPSIAKIFADAGLHDVVVGSGAVVDGSVIHV